VRPFLEAKPMSTTTIRLSDDLKSRIAKTVKHKGTTTHSFILEAIAEKIDQEEQRIDFENAAETRFAKVAATGKSIPWQNMREYLQGRISGIKVKRPLARKLGR
jgi:predicted transcriptional regulator